MVVCRINPPVEMWRTIRLVHKCDAGRPRVSKLAPNWFTNVEVIDLTFLWDRPFLWGRRGGRWRQGVTRKGVCSGMVGAGKG